MADSTTTAARSAIHTSWRPLIIRGSTFPLSKLYVFCSRAIDAVGLMAALTTISLPLVMPQTKPPARFVAVVPRSLIIASLCSEPVIRAAANPLPNSTPFTAGIENNR